MRLLEGTRRRGVSFVLGGVLVCSLGTAQAQKKSAAPQKSLAAAPVVKKPAAAKPAPALPAARLAYNLKPGDTFRYRITGIFRGNFPPFAQPGNPPANLKAVLEYIATVKKQDDKGAEIFFEVDVADLSLLEKEPGPDGKIDPEDEIPFPIPVSQAQKTLNVTALIRPDGSVASVTNNDSAPIRAELGIDLRKLFLLILPVTFPDKPLQINDEWTHNDGVLGQKPGKITYRNRLLAVAPAAKNLTFRVEHNAVSQIADKKDRDGKLIEDAENAVETTTGTATVKGTLLFQTPAAPASPNAADTRTGRLQKGQLTLNANLVHVAPNPEKPEEKLASNIEVMARLTVQAIPNRRPGAKAASLPILRKEN